MNTLIDLVAGESHQPLVFSRAMEEGKYTVLTDGGLTVAYPVGMGRSQACSHQRCDCSYTHQDVHQLSHVLSLCLASHSETLLEKFTEKKAVKFELGFYLLIPMLREPRERRLSLRRQLVTASEAGQCQQHWSIDYFFFLNL